MTKRLFDVTIAFLGLLILWPVFAFIALLIKIDDFGPVFFGQVRVGQNGRDFKMWKFRTMRSEKGALLTVGSDERITRIGRWLRKLKLDEFPQLWNVFKGEMSLVGPRPELPYFVQKYTPEQRKVLELKPGITDPASFVFFDESALLARSSSPEDFYIGRIMPEKIRINREYAEQRSLWSDLFMILATLLRIVGIKINVPLILDMKPPGDLFSL